MKKLRKAIIIIVIIIVVILLIGILVLRRVSSETREVVEVDTTDHWGAIRGSLGYPSEEIPALGICAVIVGGTEEYCTYEMLEDDDLTYGLGYEIEVPPGDYNVYSYLVDSDSDTGGALDDYKAYYSKFVTCGMDISCTSHKALKVSVERNTTENGIDPIDWYNF